MDQLLCLLRSVSHYENACQARYKILPHKRPHCIFLCVISLSLSLSLLSPLSLSLSLSLSLPLSSLSLSLSLSLGHSSLFQRLAPYFLSMSGSGHHARHLTKREKKRSKNNLDLGWHERAAVMLLMKGAMPKSLEPITSAHITSDLLDRQEKSKCVICRSGDDDGLGKRPEISVLVWQWECTCTIDDTTCKNEALLRWSGATTPSGGFVRILISDFDHWIQHKIYSSQRAYACSPGLGQFLGIATGNFTCFFLNRKPSVCKKLLPWPKTLLRPRYSWGWSAVRSCDIIRHRLWFATRVVTRRYCGSRRCRTEARYRTISHDRTADQPREFLGCDNFFLVRVAGLITKRANYS